MIVLDTNVISELIRAQPNPAVIAWAAAQPPASLCAPGMARSAVTGAVPVVVVGGRGDLEVEVLYGP